MSRTPSRRLGASSERPASGEGGADRDVPVPIWSDPVRRSVTLRGRVVTVGPSPGVAREKAAVARRERQQRRVAEQAGRPRGLSKAGSTPAPVVHTGLSRKARASMVKTLCSLDMTPLVSTGTPCWVRLSLPGPHLRCSAGRTGPQFRRALDRLWARWRRCHGDLALIWKIEFPLGDSMWAPGRVAPHVHLLASVPDSLTITQFHRWLGDNWAECVQYDDDLEDHHREAHRLNGCWVRYADDFGDLGGATATYFAFYKPGSRGRTQDTPPEEWLLPGCGLRRLWGYRGLKPSLDEEVALTAVQEREFKRLMRRWERATHGPRRRYKRRGNGRRTHYVVRHPLSRGSMYGQVGGWLVSPRAPEAARQALTWIGLNSGASS